MTPLSVCGLGAGKRAWTHTQVTVLGAVVRAVHCATAPVWPDWGAGIPARREEEPNGDHTPPRALARAGAPPSPVQSRPTPSPAPRIPRPRLARESWVWKFALQRSVPQPRTTE